MKSVTLYFRKGAAALLLLLAALPLSGQVKDRQHSDRLESARKLYYNGSYYAAEKAFTELGKESLRALDMTEIEAYKVMCAIALDKVNAEGQVNTFCSKYPNAPQQSMVREALASRYFDTGHYVEALEVYNNIDPTHLYRGQRTGFTFKKAYWPPRIRNIRFPPPTTRATSTISASSSSRRCRCSKRWGRATSSRRWPAISPWRAS